MIVDMLWRPWTIAQLRIEKWLLENSSQMSLVVEAQAQLVNDAKTWQARWEIRFAGLLRCRVFDLLRCFISDKM